MKETKMNVLFFITDQQRADMLHCYGNNIIKTPNLDKFASECVRFTNAFCTNPMCMPNRATLLTGYYPNVHGVRSNGINLPEDIPTITQSLVKSGYHTISVGKTHFNFWVLGYDPKTKTTELFDDWKEKEPKREHLAHKNFPIPYYGFEEVKLVLGHGGLCLGHYLEWLEERSKSYAQKVREEYKDIPIMWIFYESFLPEELYNTSYIEEETIRFLNRYSKGEYGDKPFFLQCSFPDPHHPVGPPGKYATMYDPKDMVLPETFHDIDELYAHPYMKTHMENPPMRGALLRETTEDELRKFMALNYGSVTMIDHAIGRILASLESLNLADNTMVIFTSDHGDYMGDKGMILKGPSPYSGTLQVPLIWKVPGITTPGVSKALISSIDIPRTIMELLNIKEKKRPPKMQGVDVTPILKNVDQRVRNGILITEDEEVGPRGPLYTRLVHWVTEDYKLTRYAELPDYGDLFDRKKDPLERNNLWDQEKELGLLLTNQLFQEYMITRSRFPERQGGT